jgi:hypothetical protein
VQLRSAKLGTPELGKFFPELPSVVAKTLGKGAFADGPSRQRGHILFNFFLSTLTNTYIYIYTAALFYILGVEWDSTPNQPNSSVNLTPTQTDSTPPPPDPLRHPAPFLFHIPTGLISVGKREPRVERRDVSRGREEERSAAFSATRRTRA